MFYKFNREVEMGIRFRKSIKLFPGIEINLSKSGVGISTGLKGFHISNGPSGTRVTSSIPGTGISYSRTMPKASQRVPNPKDKKMRDYIQADIKNQMRIMQDSLKLISDSKSPDVIVSRMRLLDETLEDLAYYYNAGFHMLKTHPESIKEKYFEHRDEIVADGCERCFMDQWVTIPKFKNRKTQIDHWQKFLDDAQVFYNIISDRSKIDKFLIPARNEMERLQNME
jgi:hypothetical protein